MSLCIPASSNITPSSTRLDRCKDAVGVLITAVGPYYIKAVKNIEDLLSGVKFTDKILKMISAIAEIIREAAHSVAVRAGAHGLNEWVKDARFIMSIPGVISGVSKIKEYVSQAAELFGAIGKKGEDEDVVHEGKNHRKVFHGDVQKALGGFAKLSHFVATITYVLAFGVSRPIALADKINKEYIPGAKISESARSMGNAFAGFLLVNHIGTILAHTAETAREAIAYVRGNGEYKAPVLKSGETVKAVEDKIKALKAQFLKNMVLAIIDFLKNGADLLVDFLKLLKVTGSAVVPVILACNVYIASIDLFKIFVDQKWTPDPKKPSEDGPARKFQKKD